MIVVEPKASQKLLVVRQSDHARAAARLARSWERPISLPAEAWRLFLEALRRHDDGWDRADAEPRVDSSGRPYDFRTLPTPEHIAVWRHSVEQAESDPYVALIVALHARWLYTQFPKEPGEAGPVDRTQEQAFIQELTQRMDGYLSQLRTAGAPGGQSILNPGNLERIRRLMSFFDVLSLAMIGALKLPGTTEALSVADQEHRLSLDMRPGEADTAGVLHVNPWPFDHPSKFTVSLPCKRLDAKRFDDDRAFVQALDAAPEQRLSWLIRPAPASGASVV